MRVDMVTESWTRELVSDGLVPGLEMGMLVGVVIAVRT
jgi:hypothetical protein